MRKHPEFFEYEQDATIAEEMLQRVSSRPAERRAYHGYLVQRAKSELYLPPHWFAVHTLARELVRVGSVGGRVAARHIDAALLADEAWTLGKRRRLADVPPES